MHVLWGVLLLAGEPVAHVTPVHGVQLLVPGHVALGVTFLVIGGLAVYARLRCKEDRVNLFLIGPQQLALSLNACAAVGAAFVGHYADGVVRSHTFILADQTPLLCLFTLHTLVLIGWVRSAS